MTAYAPDGQGGWLDSARLAANVAAASRLGWYTSLEHGRRPARSWAHRLVSIRRRNGAKPVVFKPIHQQIADILAVLYDQHGFLPDAGVLAPQAHYGPRGWPLGSTSGRDAAGRIEESSYFVLAVPRFPS